MKENSWQIMAVFMLAIAMGSVCYIMSQDYKNKQEMARLGYCQMPMYGGALWQKCQEAK
jgi:hypothetical protein